MVRGNVYMKVTSGRDLLCLDILFTPMPEITLLPHFR